jgi:hypothetical protein
MLSSELVLATFIFVIAIAVIHNAYVRTLESAYEQGAWEDEWDGRISSSLLLDSQGTLPAWDYANHEVRPLTLSSNGSINLSRVAMLVAMLNEDETATRNALQIGPYKIGISVKNQSNEALNTSCPDCSCNGQCFVTLAYTPTSTSNNVLVTSATYRLVYANGSGAGIGRVQMEYYRTYDFG